MKRKFNKLEYYADLGYINNHETLVNIDLFTITGFMDTNQRIQHIIRYAQTVNTIKGQSIYHKYNDINR